MKLSFYDEQKNVARRVSIDDFLSKTIMYGTNGWVMKWKNGYGMELGFGKWVVNNDECKTMDLLLHLQCFL